MSEGHSTITTVEVKRYAYCPKIVYFTHVLHLQERETEAMEFGRNLHGDARITPLLKALKARRVLEGVELESRILPLSGKLDYLVETRHGEYVPVEVKWAEPARGGLVKRDHKLQLAAYAVLVEENLRTVVKRGGIYYERAEKALVTPITVDLKTEAKKAVSSILLTIRREEEPNVKQPISKCLNCGYYRYCLPLDRTGF